MLRTCAIYLLALAWLNEVGLPTDFGDAYAGYHWAIALWIAVSVRILDEVISP